MVAIETESIDNAITAGLPSTVAGVPSHYVSAQVPATDDEQLSTTSFLNNLAQQQVTTALLQYHVKKQLKMCSLELVHVFMRKEVPIRPVL